ncbi:replication endonuclease [Salmonella enterica]|uniref:replication endonuclease n=2 Tax=Salmonella enterica TaxID=28901 RepID=UPI000A55FE94|nr:replication endonuclease [Salmonella enterica]
MTVTRGRCAPTPPPPYPGKARDMTAYLYPWNSPDYDAAAANELTPEPVTTSDDQGDPSLCFEYLTPDGERRTLTYEELQELCNTPLENRGLIEQEKAAEKEREKREKYLRRRLQSLPGIIRRRFALKLAALDGESPERAVKWLFGTFERHILRRVEMVNVQYYPCDTLPALLLPMRDDFHLLPWADKKKLRRMAYTLSRLMKTEFESQFDYQYSQTEDLEFSILDAYGCIASKARALNIAIPGWDKYSDEELDAEEALRAVGRLQAEKWWLGKLKRIHDRWREHLMIAAGYVSKQASPKCSEPCLKEWLAQQKANMAWLHKMELEDKDTGERSPLIDKVLASTSNPKIARMELTTRAAGFQDIADEMGLIGMFFTLTAPSSYHSTHIKDGKRNDKYNGASPRKTQKYLCKVWSRVRAAWQRRGIRTFGFRTVEPHHDGTPHWHMVLWFKPEDLEKATTVFRTYALQEDGDEPGAEDYRFEAVQEDKSRGRAVGYIVKYISKNIDGHGLDGEVDKETGRPLKEEARRVKAWASRWNIRQFQQIGGAPVTIWRELRRLGDRELVLSPEIEAVRAVADASDWQHYTMYQGGPFVARDDLTVRLYYSHTENGNDYGDTVSKIEGVYSPFSDAEDLIYTRTASYNIVPKLNPAPSGVLPLTGREAAPWSSVNNCTQTPEGGEKSDSKPTELPRNIDDLRRYSRQQKQEITDRLKREPRLSADEAFTATIQHMKATINDVSDSQWGPEVKAAYREFIDLTPEEQAEHWRKKLHEEALQRAASYASADAIYQQKKAEAVRNSEQRTDSRKQERRISETSGTQRTLHNLLARWQKATRGKNA